MMVFKSLNVKSHIVYEWYRVLLIFVSSLNSYEISALANAIIMYHVQGMTYKLLYSRLWSLGALRYPHHLNAQCLEWSINGKGSRRKELAG